MTKDTKNTAIYVAYDDFEPFVGSSPERNLLSAVLLTAISDLSKGGEVQNQAREYFLSPEEDYLFSFRSICSYLNVDPKQVLQVAGVDDSEGSKTGGPDTATRSAA